MALDLAGLLHRGDLDELVRVIDAASLRGDWDDVEAIRVGAQEALERSGRQLWGPAAYAAYRLSLDAPVAAAVTAALAGHDRHTLGPLTEVIAQHHRWDELVAALPPGPVRGVVAVERAARGEDLRGDPRAEVGHLDVPAVWHPWEGVAPVARYGPAEVVAPAPRPTSGQPWGDVTDPPGREVSRPVVERALMALVEPWATTSAGTVDVVVVDGGPESAVAALVPGVARMRAIGLADAMAWCTWAGASGGAHGRRRGVAAGRSAAWWAMRAVVDDLVDDVDDPDDVEFALEDCSFHEFSDGGDHGWRLHVAITHPDGWTAAIAAEDHDDEEGGDGDP